MPTTSSVPVDLVILMDTSVSMKDEAVALSAAASAAIDLAKGSCPSDLRVTWLGLEGVWKGTHFNNTVHKYLNKVAHVAPGDLLSRKKGELAGGGAQEDGARNIEDVTMHFDWREGAARAIFYLTDEALDAGGDRVTPSQTTAADKAIATAKAGGVTLHTYFGTTKSRFKAGLHKEFARVANATGGQAFTDKDSIGGFAAVLEKIICASQVVKEPETQSATTGFPAPVPTFFSTGVDNNGKPLAAELPDPHYTITDTADASGTPASVVVSDPEGLGWNGNTATSGWISTGSGGGEGTVGASLYYAITFDLTGFDPATAQIVGSIAADDSAIARLNGTQVATSPAGGYEAFTALSITTGFVAGSNTLTIEVVNGNGLTGLQLSAAATAVPVAASAPAVTAGTPVTPQPIDPTPDNIGASVPEAPMIHIEEPVLIAPEMPDIVGPGGMYNPGKTPSGDTPGNAQGSSTGEVKPITTFFSTGVDNAGIPLAAGFADPHWTLTGVFGGPRAFRVTNPSGLGWCGNTSTSSWISADANSGNGTAGIYLYTLVFDLSGFDPATAQISGTLSVDDTATIRLNGATIDAPAYSYGSLTPLSITSGFVAGSNTLTIEVMSIGGPAGLQISATATAKVADVTQPAAIGGTPATPQPIDPTPDNMGASVPEAPMIRIEETVAIAEETPGIIVGPGTMYKPDNAPSTDISTGEVKPVSTFFSTGVDNAGIPLAAGFADPHWTLTGVFGGPRAFRVTNPSGLGWCGNTSTSSWISADANSGNGTAGIYLYTLVFDLSGFDPATAQISGTLSVDDTATIRLNGATIDAPAYSYGSLTPLSITSGFVAGSNTLTIEVMSIGGPAGLQISATATATTIGGSAPGVTAVGTGLVAPELPSVAPPTQPDVALPVTPSNAIVETPVTPATPATPAATSQGSGYIDGLYVFHQGDNDNTQLWCSVFTGSGWLIDKRTPNVSLNFSPSAVMYQGYLYVFYANAGLWYIVHDGDMWGGSQQVANVSISDAPCAVEFNGLLYVFHQGGGNNTQLWYSTFDGSTWSADTQVPNVGLNFSPSAVVFQNKLYVFHEGNGLWLNVFDGTSWTGDTQLVNYGVSYAPCAVEYNGKLYEFHQGGAINNELWYSVFDGSAWGAYTRVPGATISFGPNAVVSVADGKLYIFHEGGGNDNALWYSVFDGASWSSGTQAGSAAVAQAQVVYEDNFDSGASKGTADALINAGSPENSLVIKATSGDIFANTIPADASGSGYFLFSGTYTEINTDGNALYISPAFAVTPNTDYMVSFSLTNAFDINIAQIQPQINGVALGAGVSAVGTYATNGWQTFSFAYNSGAATSAVLSLHDLVMTGIGNDVGVDNILVVSVPGAAATQTGDTHVVNMGISHAPSAVYISAFIMEENAITVSSSVTVVETGLVEPAKPAIAVEPPATPIEPPANVVVGTPDVIVGTPVAPPVVAPPAPAPAMVRERIFIIWDPVTAAAPAAAGTVSDARGPIRANLTTTGTAQGDSVGFIGASRQAVTFPSNSAQFSNFYGGKATTEVYGINLPGTNDFIGMTTATNDSTWTLTFAQEIEDPIFYIYATDVRLYTFQNATPVVLTGLNLVAAGNTVGNNHQDPYYDFVTDPSLGSPTGSAFGSFLLPGRYTSLTWQRSLGAGALILIDRNMLAVSVLTDPRVVG